MSVVFFDDRRTAMQNFLSSRITSV